ncbi:uncharacterized protein LOC105664897 [Ceratitis capitata]|uniref:uncharacterized protein LOC105664897 n=1 Tax=Ceratitis capitata TaxID=7213 RepID=UPI0006187FAB|nr:uncharacterized protein LOC105664897 [Ceratitis capitata]
MYIILIFAALLLPNAHTWAAQQTYALRDPRIRQLGTAHANRQPLDVSAEQTATFNATTLLKHLPAYGFNANINERRYQPQYTATQRATPPEVAKYRNLGNYFQIIPPNSELTMLAPPAAETRERREHKPQLAHLIPISFNHHVFHWVRAPLPDTRPRRYTNVSSSVERQQDELQDLNALDSKVLESQAVAFDSKPDLELEDNVRDEQNHYEEYPKLLKKTQSFHDIYLRYNPPHQVSFGHVEFKPNKHFEKRFESLNENDGNRHRGEIIWADATGGYGEHHWDLTQGKLR